MDEISLAINPSSQFARHLTSTKFELSVTVFGTGNLLKLCLHVLHFSGLAVSSEQVEHELWQENFWHEGKVAEVLIFILMSFWKKPG